MSRTAPSNLLVERKSASPGAFLNALFPAPRSFNIRLWDGSTLYPAPDRPKFTIVLRHEGAARRMFHLPVELSLAEAYIRGDFDIEGDMVAAFQLMDDIGIHPWSAGALLALGRQWISLPVDQHAAAITRGPLKLSGRRHSKARDRAAVQYHYDVGNEFYALWLDKRMNYSCAYFKTGAEDIDTAQEQKLEHICRKLRLQPGERLLDVGCGWGGLVIYTAQHCGVSVLGVTLSEKQAALANQRIKEAGLGDRAAVELLDYRDLADQSFDKAVSVGMFEHVGRSHLPEYFAHINRLLKPGGLFLNHGISVHPQATLSSNRSLWDRLSDHYVLGSGIFSQRYIFPDGELVPVSAVNAIAESNGFEVRDVENLREHYALTLRHWVNRLESHREEATRLADETIYRTWKLYLSGSVYGFEAGRINMNQSLLAKLNNGCASVPLTRDDLYA
ncbi:MAG: cyclopropane-fatty-acyl-phospholipid synthase family protein [Chloroflexi bacterium]|nr:cyclopropane-fatty-acyl-phospholipid synthase family protein [Chloroflexota bacterium]